MRRTVHIGLDQRRHSCARWLLLAILLLPQPASAGGWVQELRAIYAKLTYGSSSTNSVYRFDGELKYPTDNPPYTVRDYPIAERSLYLYAEYGLLERLTFVGSIAMKRVIVTSPVERKQVQGFGDCYLGGRYLITSFDQQVVSATVGVTVPTGYSRDLTPPLGSGNVNVEIGASYGISVYPIPAYATASLGYRLRTGLFPSTVADAGTDFKPSYADEIVPSIEIGYTLADRVLLHALGNALFSTRMDDNDFDVEHPPETQQYIKIGAGVIVKAHDGFAVSADVFVTPYGRKASNSLDLFLGVSWSGNLTGGGRN